MKNIRARKIKYLHKIAIKYLEDPGEERSAPLEKLIKEGLIKISERKHDSNYKLREALSFKIKKLQTSLPSLEEEIGSARLSYGNDAGHFILEFEHPKVIAESPREIVSYVSQHRNNLKKSGSKFLWKKKDGEYGTDYYADIATKGCPHRDDFVDDAGYYETAEECNTRRLSLYGFLIILEMV